MRKILIPLLALFVSLTLNAQPPVPNSAVFAGQAIGVSRPYFYGRMDRELIAFT